MARTINTRKADRQTKAGQLIREARRELILANDRFGYKGDEGNQARQLLEHVLDGEVTETDEVPPRQQQRFKRLVERRASGEPMAYILGWIDFLDFRLDIKPGVFVPRLTSEFLAAQAMRRLRGRRNPVHVDLATGIGPIALAVARGVPHAMSWGLDISIKAVNQAKANANKMGLGNAAFRRSDLFSSLDPGLQGTIDVITAHLPYVSRREVADLPAEIKEFEPRHTLTDGSGDGMGLVQRAVFEGAEWLRPGGWLLMEIVPGESRFVRSKMKDAGYADVRSTCGPMRFTRVIAGRT